MCFCAMVPCKSRVAGADWCAALRTDGPRLWLCHAAAACGVLLCAWRLALCALGIICLLQRTGGYHKYVDYGNNLTAQDPRSVGFMSGAALAAQLCVAATCHAVVHSRDACVFVFVCGLQRRTGSTRTRLARRSCRAMTVCGGVSTSTTTSAS